MLSLWSAWFDLLVFFCSPSVSDREGDSSMCSARCLLASLSRSHTPATHRRARVLVPAKYRRLRQSDTLLPSLTFQLKIRLLFSVLLQHRRERPELEQSVCFYHIEYRRTEHDRTHPLPPFLRLSDASTPSRFPLSLPSRQTNHTLAAFTLNSGHTITCRQFPLTVSRSIVVKLDIRRRWDRTHRTRVHA